MKKLIKYLFITLQLFGCTIQKDYPTLSLETASISDTMVNYFNLDQPQFEGNAFQVKSFRIDTISIPLDDPEVTYYRIHFVIAPKTEMPFEMKSLEVHPSNQFILDYFKLPDSLAGYGSIKDWNYLTSKLNGFKFPLDDHRFTAYEYSSFFNSRGKIMMETHNMDNAIIESAFKNLDVIIKYDDKTDIIKLTDLTINPLTSLDQIADDDTQLLNLVQSNQTQSSFKPFR